MCDTITALGHCTRTGSVLFGKNSDREYNEPQHLEFVPARSDARSTHQMLTYVNVEQTVRTNAVLLSKPVWIWGAEIGANDHGLVIGNEALFSSLAPSTEPGIIGMDYVRLGLERSASVDEAISVITTMLERHGQSGNCGLHRTIGYDNSFMLTDKAGSKVLETVGRDWVVKAVDDYCAISNTFLIEREFDDKSAGLAKFAHDEDVVGDGRSGFSFKAAFEDSSRTASGTHRRARASELLRDRNGRLELTDFFAILRDHKEGELPPGASTRRPKICSHAAGDSLGQTTASWVANLHQNSAVHWVTGTSCPCTSLFKPVMISSQLPAFGVQPARDGDHVSLWWRHDEMRRQLELSDVATQDQYRSERDRLEAAFTDRVERATSKDGDSSEIGRLIRQCWTEASVFEDKWYARLHHA